MRETSTQAGSGATIDSNGSHLLTMAVDKGHPSQLTFVGRPLAHWIFGLRTWASMLTALYIAFWLQLDGASSAAVTAAILALPTRGQAFDKALYRLAGTAAGVVASIVIAGVFNEVRTLFLVAVAAWLALCVFVANMLDGNRAYAVVLSGYTVALVAVADIDDPGSVFTTGIDRGAAIVVAIVVVGVINDLLGAPNLLAGLAKRVDAAHAEVRAFARRALDRGAGDAVEVARLLGRITALRGDALLLRTESLSGRARAAAARRAISELAREVRAARIFGATLSFMGQHGPEWRDHAASAIDTEAEAELLIERANRVIADRHANAPQLIAARSMEAVVRSAHSVEEAFVEMMSGRGTARGPRLPAYHPRRGAARNALRTFLSVLAAAAILILAGLPSASGSLLFVCILAGLSVNSADPWKFMVGALVAIPLAGVTAGITEFLILDGADAYPLLAIALLPTILAGCLLMSAGKPALFGIGFLFIVFTPALMSLANPQSYNPFVYLNQTLFIAVAAVLLATAIAVLLPTDDVRRRRWMIGDARRDLRDAIEGRHRGGLATDEASFRAADLIAQLAALKYRDERQRAVAVSHVLHLTEVAFAARRVRDAFGNVGGVAAGEAGAALAALDAPRLRRAAERLRETEHGRWAGADAARTAALIERYGADIALASAGRAP